MRGNAPGRPRYTASRAEKIAAGLAQSLGAQALERAHQRKRRAEALGHHGQIDLYIAVCAILGDRGGVFSRSRASHVSIVPPLSVVSLAPRPEAIGPLATKAA